MKTPKHKLHKSARDWALKYKALLGRWGAGHKESAGLYFLMDVDRSVLSSTDKPTAKAAIEMMKKHGYGPEPEIKMDRIHCTMDITLNKPMREFDAGCLLAEIRQELDNIIQVRQEDFVKQIGHVMINHPILGHFEICV